MSYRERVEHIHASHPTWPSRNFQYTGETSYKYILLGSFSSPHLGSFSSLAYLMGRWVKGFVAWLFRVHWKTPTSYWLRIFAIYAAIQEIGFTLAALAEDPSLDLTNMDPDQIYSVKLIVKRYQNAIRRFSNYEVTNAPASIIAASKALRKALEKDGQRSEQQPKLQPIPKRRLQSPKRAPTAKRRQLPRRNNKAPESQATW